MGTYKSAVFTAAVIFVVVWTAGLSARHFQSNGHSANQVSPVRGIVHKRHRHRRFRVFRALDDYRSIDGTGNNQDQPLTGSIHQPLSRWMPSDYEDGISEMSGAARPGARAISNGIARQDGDIPNRLGSSDFVWQWGQFLDHDIDLTDGMDPPEPVNIPVPQDDAHFLPGTSINLNRSVYSPGAPADQPRQQLNEITAWIDASNVYGSDETRANALRTLDGTGQLKTSDGNMLPFNTEGLPNAGGDSDRLFLAGDVRANEQLGLTAMHTLFVREHNRLAKLIKKRKPDWSGDQIYQKARQLVGAEMQAITYREFLPALLGRRAIPRYRGYRPDVPGGIANMFSTAAYRFGHSAISSQLRRLDEDGNETSFGHLALRDAFFRPNRLITEGGIEPVLRGLVTQRMQAIDTQVIDDLRNFLFGDPMAGGLDLVSLNIQRGRDHGLPSYNDVREEMGFGRATDWSDISANSDVQLRLQLTYTSVDDVDLWVGGLSEDPVRRSHLGPLFHKLIKRQFLALRDGDRFWYQRTLARSEIQMVESLTLAKIIRLNTDIGYELPKDVFRAQELRPALKPIKVKGKKRPPYYKKKQSKSSRAKPTRFWNWNRWARAAKRFVSRNIKRWFRR